MLDFKVLLQFYLHLTNRQRDVVELVCDGLSNRQIGDILCIDKQTVAEHLTTIYAELGTLSELEYIPVRRPLLIRVYAPFLDQHPELRSATLHTPNRLPSFKRKHRKGQGS